MIIFLGFKPALGMERAEVQLIVGKLEKLTGQNIEIVMEDSMKPDAYLHPLGYIVINRGLMGFVEDDAEMAFIISHELAHRVRGHYKGEAEVLGISKDVFIPGKLQKELDADAYGLKFMKAAGYESDASIRVLNRLSRMMGYAQHTSGGYSSLEERIDALKKLLMPR